MKNPQIKLVLIISLGCFFEPALFAAQNTRLLCLQILLISPQPFMKLRFNKRYRVNQHYLLCAVIESVIYVVTIQHGSMDIPNRLLELEPTLQREVEILHDAFLCSLKQ